jgi:hypothetical protein
MFMFILVNNQFLEWNKFSRKETPIYSLETLEMEVDMLVAHITKIQGQVEAKLRFIYIIQQWKSFYLEQWWTMIVLSFNVSWVGSRNPKLPTVTQ